MKPIRVALVSSDTSLQSGAARCLLRLATGLRDLGHEPVMLLSDHTGIAVGAKQAGIEVYRTRARRPALRRGWRGVAAWVFIFPGSSLALAFRLRRLRVDIVHANEFIELQAGAAARLARLPCVYHVRWPLGMSVVERCAAACVAVLSSGLVFVSKATRGLFLRAAGGSRGRPVWVINDPGPEVAAPDPGARAEVRRELGFPVDSLLVLHVSKLIPHKGQDVFLKAAASLAPAVPEARFILVGGMVAGHDAYAREVGALASRHSLQGRVVLPGHRGDVPRLMTAADVVVHTPTIPESFPGVVLEAMAVGRAIIASDIGGIPEQITNGVTGVLVKPGQPGELAQAIVHLLADADLRARLGAAARQAYQSRYSTEKHAAAVIRVYRQVLQGPGAPDRCTIKYSSPAPSGENNQDR